MNARQTSAGLAVLLLCACSDPVTDAKQQFEMVKRNATTLDEVCAAHRKLVNAYLNAKDEKGYAFEKLLADSDCLTAQLNPGGLYDPKTGRQLDIVSDNMTAVDEDVSVPAPTAVSTPNSRPAPLADDSDWYKSDDPADNDVLAEMQNEARKKKEAAATTARQVSDGNEVAP